MELFAFPNLLWYLALGLLAAYLAVRALPSRRLRLLSRLIRSPALRGRLALGTDGRDLRPAKQRIFAGAVIAAALALAGPQWGVRPQEIPSAGGSLIMALDVSDSMLAEDLKPNRIGRVKLEIREAFLKKEFARPVRLGLVTFSGQAYLQCPLTLDTGALGFMLETVGPGTLPVPGTNIAAALETALSMAAAAGGAKDILLATDGEDHEGDARSLIPKLKKYGVRVHTLWAGSLQGEPIPLRDENGGFLGYKKDKDGQTVISKAEGNTLEELSRETQGRFIRLEGGTDPQAELRSIPGESDNEKGKQTRLELENRFQIPLALALVLLLMEMAIPEKSVLKT